MIPLCTTTILLLHAECGWALLSVTAPWVAHLVCPTPAWPAMLSIARLLFTFSTFPTPFLTRILPPSKVATPTLSYPLYSILLRLLTRIGAAGLLPLYPIMEHTG